MTATDVREATVRAFCDATYGDPSDLSRATRAAEDFLARFEVRPHATATDAFADYVDHLGVDANEDHTGDWWDGYRQAQRENIRRATAALEAAFEVHPRDKAIDSEVERSCEIMHDAYEAAAIAEGWSTQEASRKPWADVPEANKRTMRAAVRALLEVHPHGTATDAQVEAAYAAALRNGAGQLTRDDIRAALEAAQEAQ